MLRCDKHYQLVEQVETACSSGREFCQYLLTTYIYIHLIRYIYVHTYSTSTYIRTTSTINLHLAIGQPRVMKTGGSVASSEMYSRPVSGVTCHNRVVSMNIHWARWERVQRRSSAD